MGAILAYRKAGRSGKLVRSVELSLSQPTSLSPDMDTNYEKCFYLKSKYQADTFKTTYKVESGSLCPSVGQGTRGALGLPEAWIGPARRQTVLLGDNPPPIVGCTRGPQSLRTQ